jgi:hypothetical protein
MCLASSLIGKLFFTNLRPPAMVRAVMDQFWSVLSMPIGLMLCFTPILIAWILNEVRNDPINKKERK